MAHYRYHLFVCINQRDPGRQSCGQGGSSQLREQLKARVRELGLSGPGGVRINTAGCMGRCGQGPVVVVYPEGLWYRIQTREDIEEIVQEHLLAGRVVERLRLTEPDT